MTQKYIVKTLGCKANLYDSQMIEAELSKRGWQARESSSKESPKEFEEDSVEICIVNSCTVTDEADKQSRKMAAKLARLHPRAKIVMTGCGAEVDPALMAKSKGVDFVVGNRDKSKMLDLVLEAVENPPQKNPRDPHEKGQVLGQVAAYEEMNSRHPMDRDWPAPEAVFMSPARMDIQGESSRKRAFLKIQEGCNQFCTYCVIPYGRGPSRSLSVERVIEQVRVLIEQGVHEVVLTGTNIGDYGIDFDSKDSASTVTNAQAVSKNPPQAEALMERILFETTLKRLRVGSLDPTEITQRLLNMIREVGGASRFCPHFHVSLQSPHTRVLRAMKRKYTFEDVKVCLEAIACLPAPVGGPYVGMDVITGFPGETDEEFQWTLEALRSLPWSRLHVFPYSERSGTPATRITPVVPPSVRARRADILRALSFERVTAHYQRALSLLQSQEGTSHSVLNGVLVDGRTPGPDGTENWWGGYTSHYLRVIFRAPSRELDFSNQLVSVKSIDVLVDRASGEAALTGILNS